MQEQSFQAQGLSQKTATRQPPNSAIAIHISSNSRSQGLCLETKIYCAKLLLMIYHNYFQVRVVACSTCLYA